MAYTKVGDKDESISGDDASVTPFNGPDRGSEYDHILTEILDNKAIKEDSKIKNLWRSFDVCKDHNKINALKWKDLNNKIAKPLQISNDNGSALRMKFSVPLASRTQSRPSKRIIKRKFVCNHMRNTVMTVSIKKLGIKSKPEYMLGMEYMGSHNIRDVMIWGALMLRLS